MIGLDDLNLTQKARWLVTGAAGFIGSNLATYLLSQGQDVVGLDNFATGHKRNLDFVRQAVGAKFAAFEFIEGDIRDRAVCASACKNVDIVLHQAALGSVPRSISDPLTSADVNITGFLNVIDAARKAGVRRFVYASSSSVYGDSPHLPKVEEGIGNVLSPYALTKKTNELTAEVYARVYDIRAIGLRYFNVFGPHQDPNGAYAAVIPRWIGSILKGEPIVVNGDGETSRDFCFVSNAVRANVLAGIAAKDAEGQVFNVALGDRTTLNELIGMISAELAAIGHKQKVASSHGPDRAGDIRHSLADISKAKRLLNYHPTVRIREGIKETVRWFTANS